MPYPLQSRSLRTALKKTMPSEWLAQAQQLLAIPSVQGNQAMCNKALDFLIAIIKQQPGITIEEFERNGSRSILAYYGNTRPKRFRVLLNGHVDVVPATPDQFKPRIEEGRLYARGALDMKLAALVLTEAFCEIAADAAYPLGLQLVTDEEPGGYDGAKYQFEQGVRTDFYLTGEQSRNDIAIAAKGMCRLKIRFEGVSAHSGYLWRGDNAILKANALIEKLHALYPLPGEEAWVTTVNVARIQVNSPGHFNRVPDEAELHLDIRMPIEDPHFVSVASVETLFATLDPKAKIFHITLEQGHHVEASNPLLKQLIASTKKARGGERVELLSRHAQSDLRHYNLDPDCRGVEFGLKGKHDHGDNEYADIASVPIMQAALHDFLHHI